MNRPFQFLIRLLPLIVLFLAAGDLFGQSEEATTVDYRNFPKIGSRVAIWAIGELHLMYAAFVLAVPMFALLIEFIGYKTGDKRYDKLAHEFTSLLTVSFSFTATLGALLTFMLMILYPRFTNYLVSIFDSTFWPYGLLFFAEAAFLYSYYYGWGKFSPRVHLFLGLCLNIVGTIIMFIANAWLSFMMSPSGIDESGNLVSTWQAVNNYTWMPINIHRLIANLCLGGSIAAAYAGFKFLSAQTDEEKAHYDWMGYIGNFVAICALLPLPFAGYWLGSEIYAFRAQMGMVLMGGAFSWLFIIQAVLIGMLFLGANFYLWLGMERIQGAERYKKYIKYLLALVTICFIVWATPHSLVASVQEQRQMGGAHHPVLGILGVMSAKNTAVNILILTTYLSFLLYRRGNKGTPIPFYQQSGLAQVSLPIVAILTLVLLYALQAARGHMILFLVSAAGMFIALALTFRSRGVIGQILLFALSAAIVIWYGIDGYFVEATVRIGYSVLQVSSVFMVLIMATAMDVVIFRKAPEVGKIRWGRISNRAQYMLFFLAVTFTWLMGLMGYVRSGLRLHWHVYEVMQDTSVDAFTPTLGFASTIVSIIVLIFFAFIMVNFWLADLHNRRDWEPAKAA